MLSHPIFIPDLARGLMALVLLAPVSQSLTGEYWPPSSLYIQASSWAANMALYREDSSRPAFTVTPPLLQKDQQHGQRHHCRMQRCGRDHVHSFCQLPDVKGWWLLLPSLLSLARCQTPPQQSLLWFVCWFSLLFSLFFCFTNRKPHERCLSSISMYF